MSKQQLNSKAKLLSFASKILDQYSVENFLLTFYEEIPFTFKIKTVFLVYPCFTQSTSLSVVEASILKTFDVSDFSAFKNNDKIKDERRTIFAKFLARPMGRILDFDLLDDLDGQEKILEGATLFFEHDLEDKDINAFLEFLNKRKVVLGRTLKNILIENELKSDSMVWEQVFGSVSEPVVIADISGRVIRGNRCFYNRIYPYLDESDNDFISEWLQAYLRDVSNQIGQTWKSKTNIYEVHVYNLKEGGLSEIFVIYFRDMSQVYNLQIQLVQNEKMAAVGSLSDKISHELNNPLSGIKGMSQVLIKNKNTGDSVKADLCEVEKAVIRCEKVIRNLKDLSGNNLKDKTQVVSMSQLVSSTMALLKLVLNPFLVETSYVSQLDDLVEVVPELFRQVTFNLINNACQASIEGKKIIIRVQKNKNSVDLIVKDHGCGIDSTKISQIFEPFYTTKKKGLGTGLGLSMSQNIIKNFSGEILVESEIKKGSEFKVCLPLQKGLS